MIWVESAVSFIMGTIGTYLLYRGKKIQEPKMMLWGGLLIVLSYLAFTSWGKDDSSKDVLKTILSGTAGQQPQQQP